MVLELVKDLLVYVVLVVAILISVAFVTLMEQKFLGGAQVRVGPNYVGYWGMFQPFADAVKLFAKESVSLSSANLSVYFMAPIFGLSLMLVLWVIMPFLEGGLEWDFGLLVFAVISGLGVYPIMGAGWGSNCKYSMLGSLRAVAQMVSYEVSMGITLLSLVWVVSSFSVEEVVKGQEFCWNLMVFFPLGLIWLICMLAETNRTPYDFSEGESELVSGFNTEYSSGGFTLIFMAEYSSILFMSVFFCLLFLSVSVSGSTLLKGMVIGVWFVWVRATLPRYRYDKLMYLAWKVLLPVSLGVFGYYLIFMW